MKIFKLDVRTLFGINILFAIFIFFIQNNRLNHLCIITALILMILSGLYKGTLKFFLIYLITISLQYCVVFGINDNLKIMIGIIFYLITNFLPLFIIVSIMVSTIKTNELISVLEKMNISKDFIIALVVGFRYIPTIRQESRKIKENMKLRGINSNIKDYILHPFLSFEYMLVPLLFRSIKIAEELTLSAMTRGIEFEGKRSSFYNVSMKKIDYIILVLFLISTGVIVF